MIDVAKTPAQERVVDPGTPPFNRAASDIFFEQNLNAEIQPGNMNTVFS